MAVVCRRIVKALSIEAVARPHAPLPPHLAKHLETCATCAKEWNQLLGIAGGLADLREHQLVHESVFTAQVRNRISTEARTRKPSWFAPVGALASAAAALCIWMVIPKGDTHPTPGFEQPRNTGTQVALVNPHVETNSVGRTGGTGGSVSSKTKEKTTAPARRTKKANLRQPEPVSVRTMVAGNPAAKTTQTAAEKYQQWGQYYEQSGSYAQAADAYAAAATTTNSASLTYQAGYNAEMAGDVGSAVACYTKLLQNNSAAATPKKEGQGSWTELRNSA